MLILVQIAAWAVSAQIKNAGKNCWHPCGSRGGKCDSGWCGDEGACCRANRNDGEVCRGVAGLKPDHHSCVKGNWLYLPQWDRMYNVMDKQDRDCYMFNIDAGPFGRALLNIVEPEMGGYVCQTGNGHITDGEFGYTLGGCFKWVGNSAVISNGKFRFTVLDLSADICTVASFGAGKAITAAAKKAVSKSVAYGVKKSGSSWAQRKYATAQQYGKLDKSTFKEKTARQVGEGLYDFALKKATAPIRPPKTDCEAMYEVLKNVIDTKFCVIKKVARATNIPVVVTVVEVIERFYGHLHEALKFIGLDELVPRDSVGIKLDMSIDVNNFDTTLYFGFHVALGFWSPQRAAAAISTRLGENCRTESNRVCDRVFGWARGWWGFLFKTFRWVCRTVSSVVCAPFQITGAVLKRIPDIGDFMPKIKYRADNLRIATVNMGGVMNFMRLPAPRDLLRRRMLESGDHFEEDEDLSDEDEDRIIAKILENEGENVLTRMFAAEDISGEDFPSRSFNDSSSFNMSFDDSDVLSNDTEDYVNVTNVDIDVEMHEICAMRVTSGECEKMADECIWSAVSDSCDVLVDEDTEDDVELIDKETKKMEREIKRKNRAVDIDSKKFDKKLKKLGRALRKANCELEFEFLGGSSDVLTNEKYAAPGTSGEGIISHELGVMVDAVISLLGHRKVKGSTKCRRLERLAAKLADAHDGQFELRVGRSKKYGRKEKLMDGDYSKDNIKYNLDESVDSGDEMDDGLRRRLAEIDLKDLFKDAEVQKAKHIEELKALHALQIQKARLEAEAKARAEAKTIPKVPAPGANAQPPPEVLARWGQTGGAPKKIGPTSFNKQRGFNGQASLSGNGHARGPRPPHQPVQIPRYVDSRGDTYYEMPGGKVTDARLYECARRWDKLGTQYKKYCRDRARQLKFY